MFSVKPGIKYLIIHGLNKGQKIILFKKLKNENINLKEHYGQQVHGERNFFFTSKNSNLRKLRLKQRIFI